MKIPLLDLKEQYAPLREQMHKALDKILESQHFIGGEDVDALEREIADYSGVSDAVGVSSGTDALLASLMALGVNRSPLDEGPSAEVIIPSYTAKGLEFDSVIIYTEPSNYYRQSERYLYYVACTRCQHELYIYN